MTQTKTRRPRRTYTDEFKNQLVQLYLNGKRKCDIVREYEVSSSLLDKWIKQSNSTGSFKERLCFKQVLIIQNFRIISSIWCSIITIQTFV